MENKRPKQKSIATLQRQIDLFNSKHKVGDTLQARHDEHQPWIDVTVRHAATILGGHSAVGWFHELVGCHSLDFVREKPQS